MRIKQAIASGAITTRAPLEMREKAADPAEEWTPPASEPISAALLAVDQMMNDEIMEESWQVRCGQNEPEDDDDGLALE